MKKELTKEEVYRLVQDVIEAEALELIRCPDKEDHNLYIPYMMNDAVEYYMILSECKDYGVQKKDFPIDTQVELIEKEDRKGLIFRMPGGEFVTLWYSEAYSEKMFYQYHAIGHFWRKGEEQWRRLVYAIGTAYDKMEYLGKEACNEKELELIPLMNFAPFRFFTPIDEELEDRYPDLYRGVEAMKSFCEKCQDVDFMKVIQRYGFWSKCPFLSKKFLQKQVSKQLLKKERIPLFQCISEELDSASLQYPEREYQQTLKEEIEVERKKVEECLQKSGYTGTYPVFHKEKQCVVAYEEHPFILDVMDYEDFHFRIQYMVSESDSMIPNAGFFEGNGRIVRNIDSL